MDSLLKQVRQPLRTVRTDANVPRSFLAFCIWLGVALTLGQAELVRVDFDGMEPVDRELAAKLFGASVPMGVRSVVAAVCGARAGKSYVLVALRLVWGMLVRDLSSLAPGQRAVALIVAPNDKLRREVLNYAVGAVRRNTTWCVSPSAIVPKGTSAEAFLTALAVRTKVGTA